ncbi:hypothetical protein ACIBEA_30105 [Streptomyces sp. NPDC051555]|uniref:hypothetical protein n=1 Tax=Streptomyces sp. NPDC051555 TaxID=3365657 RepID=UPI00379EED4C
MDADTRLAEIRNREQAATHGPWELYPKYGPAFYAYLEGPQLIGVGDMNFGDGEAAEADLAFTLNAREDVPWLLAEVARLQAEWDEARIQLKIAEQRVEELAAENKLYERALGLNEAA